MLPKYWGGCQCQFQVNSEPSVTRVNGAFLPCQINLCRNTHISSNFCFYYFSEIPTKSHKHLAWKSYKFSSSVIFWYSIDIELLCSVSSLRSKFRIYRKKINNFEASNADESWVMNIMIHNFECPLWADKGEAPLLEIADDS